MERDKLQDELQDELEVVLNKLNTLAPGAKDAPRPPAQALARLRRSMKQDEPSPVTLFKWRLPEMFNRKYAFAALALLVMLVVAFSLPPVRAAASDFLGLFRVQKFAAISVSPEQLARLEEVAEAGLYPGEMEMVRDPGPPAPVSSLAEAKSFAGQPVKTIAELGTPELIQVTAGGAGRLLVDVESARAILTAAGVDPLLLPDSLDGAAVDVTIFPAVEQRWPNASLVQTESPVVDYPDDVDPAQLGEALLRMLGMDPVEAQRLAQDIDWTSTMLLPIPEDVASFREVAVGGESALALSSIDGQGSSLMWQESGALYLLTGDMGIDELLVLAETVE
jgi:hypothetical protein